MDIGSITIRTKLSPKPDLDPTKIPVTDLNHMYLGKTIEFDLTKAFV